MEELGRLTFDEALERAFERRRSNFLADYRLLERPALIWQCHPSEPLTIDLTSEPLAEAFRQGGGPEADSGWWDSFKCQGRPVLVFDGVSSTSRRDKATWGTEVHADGHVIAGVWTFPELWQVQTPGESVLGVADFYSEAFRDFAYFAARVFDAAPYSQGLYATCTMHRAQQLPLLGSHSVASLASNRDSLRWPLHAVGVGDLLAAGRSMAAQFLRIYGRMRPTT